MPNGPRPTAMPRFFFNLRDDLIVDDHDGAELTGLDEAKARAIREARSIASEQVKEGRLHLSHRIEVADEEGVVVAHIKFGEAVEIFS